MMVPVDKLVPGMELAADLLNLNKVLLLGKGTVLTERHLRILKTWGAESVNVVGGQPAEGEATDQKLRLDFAPEILREAESKVNRRFQHITATTGDVLALRELAVRRTAQRLVQQAHSPAAAPKPL